MTFDASTNFFAHLDTCPVCHESRKPYCSEGARLLEIATEDLSIRMAPPPVTPGKA